MRIQHNIIPPAPGRGGNRKRKREDPEPANFIQQGPDKDGYGQFKVEPVTEYIDERDRLSPTLDHELQLMNGGARNQFSMTPDVDDDDDDGIPPRRGYIRTHGIDEHLPPYPRFSPSPELIILSDEEGEESDDDDDVRSRGQSSRGARSFGRVVFSDDDDDEEDGAGQQGSEDEDGPPFLPPTTRPM